MTTTVLRRNILALLRNLIGPLYNIQIPWRHQKNSRGEPLAEHRELAANMRDFVITCSSEAHALDGMVAVMYGLVEEDTARTEKIGPTVWKYHKEIQLLSGMNEFILSVQLEDTEAAEVIGYVAFSKDELAAYMILDHNIEQERDFVVLDENGPSLKLKFNLGTSQTNSAQFTPEAHALYMALWFNQLGTTFRERFNRTRNLADLEKAISAQQRAVNLAPEGHEDVLVLLHNLSLYLQTRFNCTGNLTDLETAISTRKRIIDLTPEGHAHMPRWLNNLGSSFYIRFNRTSNLADLENALTAQKRAVDLTPEGHADMLEWLNSLGLSFQKRFDYTGDLGDLENTISIQQKAINLIAEGHTAMPRSLGNLGCAIGTRFNRTGDIADLENAISTLQRAVDLASEGHPHMSGLLNNLGTFFRTRFDRTGNLADLENAIFTLQRAVDLTPEGHSNFHGTLSNLGSTFWTRFNRTADLADLENAISTMQRAVDLTPERSVHMPGLLNNLGTFFRTRFDRTDNLADLRIGISTQQRAIDLTPQGHPNVRLRLTNLGHSFQKCFNRTGDLVDIANAISTQQKAIALTPEGHIDMPTLLNNLGVSFRNRFHRTSILADLENAISTQQEAIKLAPADHANIPLWLNNLGLSFQTRFNHTGDLADLENMISTQQRAVDLTAEGHANMPAWLNNLGSSLQMRFNHTGALEDLENGMANRQRAVDLTPQGHAKMPLRLNNLAASFQERFDHTGDLADITIAISTQQRAVDLTPEEHAHNSSFLLNLAHALRTRFEMENSIEDIDNAISLFRRSATHIAGYPSTRLQAARDWAKCSQVHDKSQLLNAFSVAIQLLSQVAGLEQTIHSRHQTLISVSDITSSATAAAIDESKLDTAISWLEQGRCLVWNQINHLRNPAEDLRFYNPSLADRFLLVARALEVSGSRQERRSTFSVGNMTEMISLQEEVHNHVDLAKKWNELLQEIRLIPELEDFLQPPQVSKILSRSPSDGPVVIFNIHEDRCDALALRFGHESPLHIPLNTFSIQLAIQLADDLRRYLKAPHVRQMRLEAGRDGSRWHPQSSEGAVMSKILRELWEHVAKPILDALAYSSHCSSLPRIWWCPTGPLAFLPIHAAGIYGKQGEPTGPCVSDYVVSSYTPTITDLLDKINATPTTGAKPISHLIISQSEPPKSSPGLSPLSGAKEETHALKNMINPPSKSLLLENASATVSRVKEEMESHGWIHFACHAIQDAAQPLKSGVQLYDGRLEVMEMLKQKLPDADLAFLSACQTSTGDEQLADEVVHLAAGMLAAGYRSVVATMWSIKDQYGPVVAKDFYEHIFAQNSAGRRLDGANAARGLHYATQKLRKELGGTERALLIWVPYVHFGV